MADDKLKPAPQSLEEIANYYADLQDGIFEFFAGNSQSLLDRHAESDRQTAHENALVELEHMCSLATLSSLEAAIRLDYAARVAKRWRDPLSRALKQVYRQREKKARLEDDLISTWRVAASLPNALASDVIRVFKYRHWLAHGRYWQPKFSRYNFQRVFELAAEFVCIMDQHKMNANTP